MPRDFVPFWKSLRKCLLNASPAGPVFNQYACSDSRFDLPNAGTIRLENLRRYLEATFPKASLLVVGEAAGPWGCRFSGVPFTGESQLLDPGFPFAGKRSSTTSSRGFGKRKPPLCSRSATMFWEVMRPYYPNFIAWDAMPFHPYQSGKPLSVRNPTCSEVEDCGTAMKLLLDWLSPKAVVAVGKCAERLLTSTGVKATYVRHPSMGGRSQFEAGIRDLCTAVLGR